MRPHADTICHCATCAVIRASGPAPGQSTFEHVASWYPAHGYLCDWYTHEIIRPATVDEASISIAAQRSRDGRFHMFGDVILDPTHYAAGAVSVYVKDPR